ncbi:cellulose binding domain-containing protein [Spirillospora sp. NPDC047279]|uniref:protein kinase domain-containing protein n=1 Tax=Spirillospora sp. NPDC047279 TaxID=3155478 RepID=UPI0033E0454C
MFTPGRDLGGRYRLVAPLGAGGMATVWRADDVVLERAVAVKTPREGWPEEFTRRLSLEAKAAARLSHPHITGVYDYGEEDGVPYVVMELLDGESLAARLAAGRLPWPEAAGIGAQLADALAAAHTFGVVHRDIKPANVFLTPTGVKVLDFGIAFTASAGPGGPLLGTPAYLAPELRAGIEPAPSADVYSFGVTMTEALGDGAPETMTDLLARCLADDPAERPTATELGAGLRDVAGIPAPAVPGKRADPPPSPLPPVPPGHETKILDEPPPEEGQSQNPEPVPESPGEPRRLLIGAAAGLAGLGLLALIFGLLQPDDPPGTGAAASPRASTPAAAGTSCAVTYAVTGQWPGGFQAEVKITNLGTAPIEGWRLSWTFPRGERITQLWNGGQEQQGAEVTVTAADWNRSVQPNGTAQFGFLGGVDGDGGDGDGGDGDGGDGDGGDGDGGDEGGDHASPERFTLNGTDCRAG